MKSNDLFNFLTGTFFGGCLTGLVIVMSLAK